MTALPDLSIITISTNEAHHLRRCLASVDRGKGDLRIEHFVIDNACTDETAELVTRDHPQVKLIRNTRKLGFATNNNMAIQRSRGRNVLLLNPDTVLGENVLPEMIAYCDRHPEVGAATCRLVNPDGSVQYNVRQFPTLWAVLLRWASFDRVNPRSRTLRRYLLSDWDHRDERDVDWVLGAFLVVRREVIEQVGMLDTAYDPLYYEDIDWCWRIKRAGWRIRYVPHVEVVHQYHRESARGVFNRMTYYHFRNILRFLARRRRMGAR